MRTVWPPTQRQRVKSEVFPCFTAADGTQNADKIKAYLEKEMQERIIVIDGAMGTTIQQYKFTEDDFRGTRCCP